MEVTKWIPYPKDDQKLEGLIDPADERLSLWNKNKHWIIPKSDIEKYASDNNVSFEEAKKELNDYNDSLPSWTDEEKAEELAEISQRCDQAIRRHCVENKIFFTDEEHQSDKYRCVPVVDDKYYLTYSLRAWSGLMADVWNEILGKTCLDYIDIYCGNVPAEVEKYLKENNLWGEEPPLADE